MKKVYKGTIEGNVIHLENEVKLPIGTHILVTLKTLYEEEQETIKQRQLQLLEKGFSLGKKLYEKRDDLYAR